MMGFGLAAFGAIFGLSALAATNPALQTFMGVYGLGFVLAGIGIIVARLTRDSTCASLRVLRTVPVSAADVTTVTVQSVAGFAYRRLRIDIHRKSGRPIKLTQLQRPDSATNLAKSETDAEAIRRALGLRTPA